jgi:predicted nucleic acid-binding protein
MKNRIVAVLALVATTFTAGSNAVAAEKIRDIQLSKAQKSALVAHFQKQITKHEKMTLAQIQADMVQGLEQNRKAVIEKDPSKAVAFDKAVQASIDAIRSADDKDLLLMSEKANLQQLMTSANYLFIVTRSMVQGLSEDFKYAPFMTSLGFVFGVPFALAADGVGFIFELAMTLDDAYNGV